MLTPEERHQIAMTGTSEADFLASKAALAARVAAMPPRPAPAAPAPSPPAGLSDVERRVVAMTGVSEAAFLAERARLGPAPGAVQPMQLTDEDRAAMRVCGLTDEGAFLAEKIRNAAADAAERS